MVMIFDLPVNMRAIFNAPSTASEPEFQKKNESKDGSGITGRSFSISLKYGSL
jgi:hypothetical protein